MKDDIKEMSKIELFLLDLKCSTEPTLTEKGKDLLLDYITNLQKDRDDLDNYNRHLHTELTNLQEELEEQKRIEKESLDKILDLEDTIVDKKECIKALEISFTNLQEENEESEEAVKYWQDQCDLRQRAIDEAIYWINEYCIKECEEGDIKAELRNVKDILKGEDKE